MFPFESEINIFSKIVNVLPLKIPIFSRLSMDLTLSFSFSLFSINEIRRSNAVCLSKLLFSNSSQIFSGVKIMLIFITYFR